MMKKMLSTKKTCTKEDYSSRLYKSDPPKRIVNSNWNIRNNSSNISSILHPEHYEYSPENSERGVYRKGILNGNTCYCRDTKIKPKLMQRPKTCLSLEDFKRSHSVSDLLRRPLKETYFLPDPINDSKFPVENVDNNDSSLLKKLKNGTKHNDILEYTPSRKEYEVFREIQDEAELEELRNLVVENNENDPKDRIVEAVEDEPNYSVSTILGTKRGTTKTASSYDLEEETDRTVEDLNEFRKEHYFETHDTGNLGKDVASHTCLHRFRLDDRLLPEPLNVDAFGRSRCSVCSRPMEGNAMQLSKSYFSDKPSRVSLRNYGKCSDFGLVPRSISLGGERSKIELRMDAGDKKKFGMLIGKMRKPEYFNTYALRQQRMSC